jgi:cupin fold WbuC family metalloprotein
MKHITSSDIEALVARAASSDRKRSNLNIHEQAEDPIQRLFIASKSDSYFRPHRHPKTWEFAIVIQGTFDILLFDDRGKIGRASCRERVS